MENSGRETDRKRGSAARQERRSLLIVGLRNLSKTYAETRHNTGAMAVERFAKRHGISINQKRITTVVGRETIDDTDLRLVLPLTYMNVSGEAVGPLVRRTGIPLSSLLIVYDEMDLPLGAVRVRPYGSAGGHNGMRSIIAALGTDRFPRLRIGIGRPERGAVDPIQYVLGHFRPDERDRLEEGLDRAADCIEALMSDGIEQAMNLFNRPYE